MIRGIVDRPAHPGVVLTGATDFIRPLEQRAVPNKNIAYIYICTLNPLRPFIRPRATKCQPVQENRLADLKTPSLYICVVTHTIYHIVLNTIARRLAPVVLCLECLPRIQLDHTPLPLEVDHTWIVAAPEHFYSRTRCLCSHATGVARPLILLLSLWSGLACGV